MYGDSGRVWKNRKIKAAILPVTARGSAIFYFSLVFRKQRELRRYLVVTAINRRDIWSICY